MPDRITINDALAPIAPAGSDRITLDEAIASYEASKRPTRISGTNRIDEFGQVRPDVLPEGSPIPPGYALRPPQNSSGQSIYPLPPEHSNFGANIKARLVNDPDTQRRILAQSLFPNDPKGIERVGFLEGSPVYVDDKGQLRRVSGKFSDFLSNIVANAPEAVGATVGSFAASPVLGGTAGAVGARGIKRATAGLVFDEPQTVSGNLTDLATEGALNLGAGLLGKGVTRFADRGKIVDFAPADLKTAEQTRAYIKQTVGIDLDLAQASGDRKLIALRNYAARYPGQSAEAIQAADEAAHGQFEQATNRVLNLVAGAKPSELAGKEGVNAAQAAIYAARQRVYSDVRPLYEAAYAAVPEVSMGTPQGAKILDYLKLPYFQEAFRDGQTLRALETGSAIKPRERVVENLVKRDVEAGTYESATTTVESTSTGAKRIISQLASGEKRNTPEGVYTKRTTTTHSDITRPSLAELDYTKRALDEKIDSLMESGLRQRANALKAKRNEFVAALDALPNQQWQLARQRYGELINAQVSPLENGPVGVLAQIKDQKLATAAAKIFSDPNVTVDQIAMTKAVLSQQNPDAYRGLVRQWMGQQYNRAMKETQTGGVVNPAGKFRQAVFGTPEMKKRAQAMLPADAAQAFDDLMLAAEKIASTPVRGSDTAFNQQITEQLKGRALAAISWIISPRQAARTAAEQRAIQSGVDSLTEALLDPAKRSQLRQIARMAPSTRQTILLGALLGGQATQSAVAYIGDDRMPLSAGQTVQ